MPSAVAKAVGAWLAIGLIMWLLHCCAFPIMPAKGRVTTADGRCVIIFDDELGTMPPRRGGPEATGEDGDGVECKLVEW